jgi:NADPH-dependent 2,4-dienoyl-CoA reductase/sulfur reductase-like enzyme
VGLLRAPGKLLEAAQYRSAFFGTPYKTGTWVTEARGRESLEGVILSNGRDRFEIACDLAAVAYGLVPNTELARSIGCQVRRGAVAVDERQQTSVAEVFCAGEPCGVAGVEVAIAEGEVAGLAAAGGFPESQDEARRLTARRTRGRRFAARLEAGFALRPELSALAEPDTTVCRCEDVSRERIGRCAGAREGKLATRAGMGPCQGRVCGPALEFLFGWDADTVRSPIKPVPLGHLAAAEDGV